MRASRLRPWIAAVALALALAPALSHRRAAVVEAGVRSAHPYRARGAVHVHTGLSGDGSGSPDDVARAASQAGLHFIVIADHNTDASIALEAYRRGVLVIGGMEKSTDAGHAVVLGTPRLPFRLDGDPDLVGRDVAELGGFVAVSHPTSSHPEGRWSGDFTGVAAVEFMNLAEPGAWPARNLGLIAPLARYAFDPQGALLRSLRYSREPLVLWDRLLARRPIAGILGSDAHGGFTAGPVRVPFPSHRELFRLASQHLLLAAPLRGEAPADRRLVLDALRQGRGYGALDGMADASGFLLEARSGGRRALMGESLPLVEEAEIRAEADAPPGTTLVLLKHGHEVARGARILHRTREAGVYRVEAYLDPAVSPGAARLPWILSNPVHVFPEAEIASRAAEAARLPPPDPLPEEAEALETFDGARLGEEWQIDRAPDAAARVSLESGSARFDFALGASERTHASLCNWRRRDLTPYAGLVLRARSDGPLRFDVQVRALDEASPEGLRIWRRSVRADGSWRSLAVPFSRLKAYDRRGGRPDLSRVQGIYLHLDEAMLPPGSRGTLWIDEVGLGR